MADKKQSIVFGGGCFWCIEAVFQRLKGVEGVISGYAGGDVENPTYEQVSTDKTGHVESVQVEFDPNVITLDDLLAVFFTSHDPTQVDRQGGDIGKQYHSTIFYNSQEQKGAIDKYIQKLTDDKVYNEPIATKVVSLNKFYEAERYHQNYYNENKNQSYCKLVIDPKIEKLKKEYSHLLK